MKKVRGVNHIGEPIVANAAMLRNMIIYLVGIRTIPVESVDQIFEHAKQILRNQGVDDLEEALAFLDHQRQSIDLANVPASYKAN